METFSGSMIAHLLINIVVAAIIIMVGRVLVRWLVKLSRKLLLRANMDAMLVNFISSMINVGLLVFVLLAALDQLGINTMSMVAVVGAAGLAIGLAMKDSLQNFASGVMLIVFRPFKLGDSIDAAGISGTVERINIFNTVLHTGDNREVIVPNSQVYSRTITNFSARETRRIELVFSIGYEDDLLKAKNIMSEIVHNHPQVLAEPAPVIRVSELAESSVNFQVWPWVKTPQFSSVRSDLLEKIKLAFDANGINIPYPQMDLHVKDGEMLLKQNKAKKATLEQLGEND